VLPPLPPLPGGSLSWPPLVMNTPQTTLQK
jgi:hypothetical protein